MFPELYKAGDEGEKYEHDVLEHAYCSLLEILNITAKQFTPVLFKKLLTETVATREWMTTGIYRSREKDYNNDYRKMVYDNNEEMNIVMGKLEDNTFLQSQYQALDAFKKEVDEIEKMLSL